MSLELELQQGKPFKSQFQKANVNLMFTYNWLSHKMKNHFAQYGITAKQYNIMRILNGSSPPVSTSYIRERLIERVSDVSRIVDRMETKELITKSASDKDKRLVDIELSSKGKDLLEEITANMYKVDDFFKNLSKKEIETLNELLDKLRN